MKQDINLVTRYEKINGNVQCFYTIKDIDVTSVIENLRSAGKGPQGPLNEESTRLQGCIELSCRNAEVYRSTLDNSILNMDGMSSLKVRHFLQNICSSNIFSRKNYLEVGCASGSTYISSNFNTGLNSSYVCDIFNELKNGKNGKDIFLENCLQHLGKIPDNIFHEDCFDLDIDKIKNKINLYLYDGDHSVDSHEKALTYFESVFDDTVVVIIDDWDDWRVQLGTILGLSKINYSIFSWQYMPGRTSFLEIDNLLLKKNGLRIFKDEPFGDLVRWWNGILVITLKKRKIEPIEDGETL